MKELGYAEVDVYVPDRTLTPKQEEEVLVRMNANTAGTFDFDKLANEFQLPELTEWGLEVPSIEKDVDYSILGNQFDDKVSDMQGGVRKAIQIEFEPNHYEEATEIVKFWRSKDLYIGKFLLDRLKQEREKLDE